MVKKKKLWIFIGLAALLLLAALTLWILWANTALVTTTYTITSENLPAAFHGFRIAQVSDLHNAEMGEGNENLLALLRLAQPDIIVITGDLIDSRNTDVQIALDFAREALTIAPCYYVVGNHEARAHEARRRVLWHLDNMGVTVLENARVELEREGESLILMGVNDPARHEEEGLGTDAQILSHYLAPLCSPEDPYTILLSHRPELFEVYVSHGIDLTLTGHAHGGQFRLPFVGGVAAPNQGLFPQYDAGLFREGETAMIVSRGIGNSVFPFRVNNRPELVVIELKKAE